MSHHCHDTKGPTFLEEHQGELELQLLRGWGIFLSGARGTEAQ